MTTRHKCILFLLLIILAVLGVSLVACSLPLSTANYSVSSWRKETGYLGDVCLLPPIHEKLGKGVSFRCLNGKQPTLPSMQANNAYQMWIQCARDNDVGACQFDWKK